MPPFISIVSFDLETVSIRRLAGLSQAFHSTLREAQEGAAKVWNDVVRIHRDARQKGDPWPGRVELQQMTKGKYALHSQTVQMICHQLLANVEATTERRRNDPGCKEWLKYPYVAKQFFPLYWPAQAVNYHPVHKRLILPMGRGRKSLVFRLELEFDPQGAKLLWNDGYELHFVRETQATTPKGVAKGCVDLERFIKLPSSQTPGQH